MEKRDEMKAEEEEKSKLAGLETKAWEWLGKKGVDRKYKQMVAPVLAEYIFEHAKQEKESKLREAAECKHELVAI